MIPFLFVCLLMTFLPVQLSAHPAPITPSSLSVPIACIALGFRRDVWTLAGLLMVLACCISAAVGCFYDEGIFPMISLASFLLPLSGFFFSIALSRRPSLEKRFYAGFWIPGVMFAAVLIVNLILNGGAARGTVKAENPEFGEYLASVANCDFFVVPAFATFGVNSFAGVCLAFVFVLCISLTYQANSTKRLATYLALASIGAFGTALHSKSFFVGLIVFVFCYLMMVKRKLFTRLFLCAALAAFVAVVVLQDDRVIDSIEALTNNDLASATSSRSILLEQFSDDADVIFGTHFRRLFYEGSPNNSYHVYFLTVIAKGGMLIGTLCFFLLMGPLVFRYFGSDRIQDDRPANVQAIFIAGHLSFLVQSLSWDIYAVQLYGLIAWMFAGAICGSATRVSDQGLRNPSVSGKTLAADDAISL